MHLRLTKRSFQRLCCQCTRSEPDLCIFISAHVPRSSTYVNIAPHYTHNIMTAHTRSVVQTIIILCNVRPEMKHEKRMCYTLLYARLAGSQVEPLLRWKPALFSLLRIMRMRVHAERLKNVNTAVRGGGGKYFYYPAWILPPIILFKSNYVCIHTYKLTFFFSSRKTSAKNFTRTYIIIILYSLQLTFG